MIGCFYYYSFVIEFEIRKCDVSSFFLSYQECFGYLSKIYFYVQKSTYSI